MGNFIFLLLAPCAVIGILTLKDLRRDRWLEERRRYEEEWITGIDDEGNEVHWKPFQ